MYHSRRVNELLGVGFTREILGVIFRLVCGMGYSAARGKSLANSLDN